MNNAYDAIGTTKITSGGTGTSSARALIPYNYNLYPKITDAQLPVKNPGITYPEDIAAATAKSKAWTNEKGRLRRGEHRH